MSGAEASGAPWCRTPQRGDAALYVALLERARQVPRHRVHVVLSQPTSSVQRLVVAALADTEEHRGSYSRPHRFPGDQTIAVLRGALWIVTWDDAGESYAPLRLDAGDFIDLRSPARYHAIVPRGPDGAVFLETLPGPYDAGHSGGRVDLDGWPQEIGRGGDEATAIAGMRRLRDVMGAYGCAA